MAQMQRCEQGHYYDASINRRCPDCGIPGLDVSPTRPVVVPAPPAKDPGKNIPAPPPTRPAAVPPIRAARENDNSTIGVAGPGANDPVVGWLIGIDGVNKGRDFRIYSEGNTIGRDVQNRISIQGDMGIHRDKHALLTYDPLSEDAAYYIQSGDLSITRLNNQPVLQPTRLRAYDIIRIGNSQFLFVPLCNERFQWTVEDSTKRSP
jgi:hypothetical protein